jgi:hypothetical protein
VEFALFLIAIFLIGELQIFLRVRIKYCPTYYSAFLDIDVKWLKEKYLT